MALAKGFGFPHPLKIWRLGISTTPFPEQLKPTARAWGPARI
jgi:hypothetical protein